MKKVILASASERRSRILSESGILHEVSPSGAREDMVEAGEVPGIVQGNAVRKARKVAEKEKNAVVIGADTLVAHGKDILGKPDNEEAARMMLKRFSGSGVDVYTGLCVIDRPGGKEASGYEKSSLAVVPLDDKEVEKYFRLLGPYDKAGGFSIEGVGAFLFDDIRGSYFNILGLPMRRLAGLFNELGLDILDFVSL